MAHAAAVRRFIGSGSEATQTRPSEYCFGAVSSVLDATPRRQEPFELSPAPLSLPGVEGGGARSCCEPLHWFWKRRHANATIRILLWRRFIRSGSNAAQTGTVRALSGSLTPSWGSTGTGCDPFHPLSINGAASAIAVNRFVRSANSLRLPQAPLGNHPQLL